MNKSPLGKLGSRLAVVLVSLLPLPCLTAQEVLPKNSIEVCSTSFRFEHYAQYLGVGIDYRFMPRPWFGFEIQGSQADESELTFEPDEGFGQGQLDGTAFAGHRWGKVGLFAEAGEGYIKARVFGGYVGNEAYNPVRTYPDFVAGGIVDVALAKRWSLTYEVRDNMTFIGAYSLAGFTIGGYYPAHTLNIPEGRIGASFHF